MYADCSVVLSAQERADTQKAEVLTFSLVPRCHEAAVPKEEPEKGMKYDQWGPDYGDIETVFSFKYY